MLRIVGGIFKNRKICTPKALTRPTSERLRESLFDILQDSIIDAKVLDLFAGSGAIGIEALSRGAKEAVFVEKDKNAILCLKKNLILLTIENLAKTYYSDALLFLKRCYEEFDIIYIDPPYNLYAEKMDYIENLLREIVAKSLLKPTGTLFLEAPQSAKILPLDNLQLLLLKNYKSGKSCLYRFVIQPNSHAHNE